MSSITLEHISLTYTGANKETVALTDLSLEIPAGESVVLIGPSGCGKSSLLQLIAGLREPTGGLASIDGVQVTRPRQRTSYILQDYGLLPWKTVLENVALGMLIQNVGKSESLKRARESLAIVDLSEFEHAYPGELSGGMRQRAALARGMASEADIMLLDEPLSALDSLTREELQNTLLDLWNEQGYTQILVTHSIEEAMFLGRTIVLMTPRPGTIREVLSNPGMGSREYRTSTEYYEGCTRLRELLIDEGAIS